VSALSLQRALDIGSYRTAWALLHRLRSVLVRPGPGPAGRDGRGGRDVHRRRRARAARRAGKGQEVPGRDRRGDQGAEGYRPMPDGRPGRRLARCAGTVRGRQHPAGRAGHHRRLGRLRLFRWPGYVHERRSQRAARARRGPRRAGPVPRYPPDQADQDLLPNGPWWQPGGALCRSRWRRSARVRDAVPGCRSRPARVGPGPRMAGGGAVRALRRPGPCERAGQRVQQQVAGPEGGGAGPDVPAGDEFQRGPRGEEDQWSACSLILSGGRSGPRARWTWTWQVPQSRSCSAGPQTRPWPARRPPSCAVTCPLSRAATHVPNGTSTIRRNDNQARAGRGPALMPGQVVWLAGAAVPAAGRTDLPAGPARSGAARPEPAADGTA
jgi:hypothetical protein